MVDKIIPADQAVVDKITPADQVPSVSTIKSIDSPAELGNSHVRVPSIKFLGKRSLLKPVVHSNLKEVEFPVLEKIKSNPVTSPKEVKQGNGVDFSTLKGGAMFGRPPISQKEIDAIESGFYFES